MQKTEQINIRIKPEIKAGAETVFHNLGITPTQAITMFYKQVSLQKGIPFEVKVSNQETLKTMEETRRGEGVNHYKEENLSHLVEEAVARYIKQPENKLNLSSVSVEEVQAQGLDAFAKPVSFETIISKSDPIPEQNEEEILDMLRQIRKESNVEARVKHLNNGDTP